MSKNYWGAKSKLEPDDYMPCECRCGCTFPCVLTNYICEKCKASQRRGRSRRGSGHGMATPDAEASWKGLHDPENLRR